MLCSKEYNRRVVAAKAATLRLKPAGSVELWGSRYSGGRCLNESWGKGRQQSVRQARLIHTRFDAAIFRTESAT
jgi:hypothetical protein